MNTQMQEERESDLEDEDDFIELVLSDEEQEEQDVEEEGEGSAQLDDYDCQQEEQLEQEQQEEQQQEEEELQQQLQVQADVEGDGLAAEPSRVDNAQQQDQLSAASQQEAEPDCIVSAEAVKFVAAEEAQALKCAGEQPLPPVNALQRVLEKVCQSAEAPVAPLLPAVGVTFVDDDADILRDVEMLRLLRQPRYFHDDFMEASMSARCFNCGKAGHRASACTSAARLKPCHLCAKFGHDARDCPAQLCFRCGHPGHKARECPNQSSRDSSWEMGRGRCLRCARQTCPCASKADYFRYEGGCTESYVAADLSKCKCYVCGQFGHLCCRLTPKLPARLTCYSCGSSSHLGEDCPKESRAHLAAERSGDMRRAQQEREAEMERVQELASRGRQSSHSRPSHADFHTRSTEPRYGVYGAPYTNGTLPHQTPHFQYGHRYTQLPQQQQQPLHYSYSEPLIYSSNRDSSDRDSYHAKRPRYDERPQDHSRPYQPAPNLVPVQPVQYQASMGVYPAQPFVFGQANPMYQPPPVHAGRQPLVYGAPPPMLRTFPSQQQQQQLPLFGHPGPSQPGQSLWGYPNGAAPRY